MGLIPGSICFFFSLHFKGLGLIRGYLSTFFRLGC